MGRPAPGQSSFTGAAPLSLLVGGIEVVQAVQEPENSVTLVANKPTAVRLYLSTESSDSIRVRGSAKFVAESGESEVASRNEVVVDPADNGETEFKRANLSRSLNFLVPAGMTAPGLLTIRVAALYSALSGEPIEFAETADLSVKFEAVPNLRLRLVGIRYDTRRPHREHVPRQQDIDLTISWLKRAYPVADVEGDLHGCRRECQVAVPGHDSECAIGGDPTSGCGERRGPSHALLWRCFGQFWTDDARSRLRDSYATQPCHRSFGARRQSHLGVGQ